MSLKNWNLALGLLLVLQGIAIAVVANSYSLPIVSQFFTNDTLASQAAGQTVLAPAAHRLFDLSIAYGLAFVAIVAGLLSLGLATIWRKKYETDLKNGINRLRWLTTLAVTGLVLVAISLISGVTDIALLIAIFAFAEITALFSILLESHAELGKKHPKVVNKLVLVSSITPWLVIGLYLLGASLFGTGALHAYIYWLDASIFILVALMAGIMYKHGRKEGNWADNVYTEKAYIMINFVIVSALLWQVYFGALK